MSETNGEECCMVRVGRVAGLLAWLEWGAQTEGLMNRDKGEKNIYRSKESHSQLCLVLKQP